MLLECDAWDLQKAQQWIEIYNNWCCPSETADDLRLVFTSNQRVERDKIEFKVAAGTTELPVGSYTPAPAPTGGATDDRVTFTYTVVDRVSVINRFGSRWAPKGQSGRTVRVYRWHTAQCKIWFPCTVSAARTLDKTAYNSPADPNFGDGTDGGSVD